MKAAPAVPQRTGEKGKKTPSSTQGNNSSLFDTIVSWWLRFDRFGLDILGVVLAATSIVTFFGLASLTKGVLLTPWINFLRRWLGWGGYVVSLMLASLGFLSLRRNKFSIRNFKLGKVLAVEGWVFTILTMLAVLSGRDLEQADNGLYGGLIGWGLSVGLEKVAPAPFSTIVLFILFIAFSLTGFGLVTPVVIKIDEWLKAENRIGKPVPVINPVVSTPANTLDETEDARGINPQVKPDSARQTSPANMAEVHPPSTPTKRDDRLPPLTLLAEDQAVKGDNQNIHTTAAKIEQTLAEFGVPSRVVGYRVGPTVTQFAVEPGYTEKTGIDGEPVRQKVRVNQISTLSRDLSRALSAERLRIEAPVPGHSFVGIEVPNQVWSPVGIRSILESESFHKLNSKLGLTLGRDVSGHPVVADLARMPHLLIAGTTGSGKSVCIAALTVCLAVNNSPTDLRLAMLDPKMVELVRFNGLPHLMGKVETKTERMLGVLRWALAEMDRRYRLLEEVHARDLESYNRKMIRKNAETLPRIVVIIDELADLMMSAPDQTEHSIVRLAQLARATGIHLIVATQRPSVDVVTGLIKANLPARVAFAVASSVDSRVILGSDGAETLLGRGDMLFLNPEIGNPTRAQGVMVTDQEVQRVVNYWKQVNPGDEGKPPWENVVEEIDTNADHLVEEAIKVVRNSKHASASLLQRKLRVGYPRAARLIDELEELGVVGPGQGGGREREVLIPPDSGIYSDDDGFGEYNSEGRPDTG